MSESLPEKPRESRWKLPRSFASFWRHGFNKAVNKSIDKYGIVLVLFALVYTIFAVLVSHKLQEAKLWGFDMSFWIQLGIPAALLVLFLGYHIFRAPYEIYLETFEKARKEIEEKELEITNLTAKLQDKSKFKPFQIVALLSPTRLSAGADMTEQCLAANNHMADCNIEIHNPNPTQSISGIGVRILKIEPAMENARVATRQNILGRAVKAGNEKLSSNSTDRCDLTSLFFPLKNVPNNTLRGGQSGYARIFIAKRMSGETFLKFDCEWNNIAPNQFNPNNEHILTIETFCDGLDAQISQFKLSFPKPANKSTGNKTTVIIEGSILPASKEPVFILEEIAPELVIHSAIYAAGKESRIVTPRVRELITFNRLHFQVENPYLGVDPNEGHPNKILTIIYSFGGKNGTCHVPEHGFVNLPPE